MLNYQDAKRIVEDKLINKTDDTPFEELSETLFGDGNCYSDSEVRKRMYGMKRMIEIIESDKESANKVVDKQDVLKAIREERVKIQTLNLERGRIDREEARQALFYETIGSVCEALPLPEFEPLYAPVSDKDYLLCVSDIHYGATFNSANNTYSREIAKERIEQLTGDTIQFIIEHQLNNIHVACLGDCVQGMLRLSDISLNDTSVVKCVVEISRLLANMLNQISKYATVNYYHVPTSNHTQTRPIGTKASEMPQEDLEYVIGHYISDLLIANSRVLVHLEEDNEYIKIPIFNYNIVALHGHQCGALVDEIKKLSVMNREFIDFLVLGHQHSSKELIGFEQSGYDAEILVAPAICGSDPYSDKLRVGAKPSAKIFGFDEVQGHTETYKFVL